MRRTRGLLVRIFAAGIAVAAGAGCAAYGEGAGAEEPARRQGAVRFTQMQLPPETISVGADEIVVWQ